MATLELLKSAREILNKTYVGRTRDNGHGGHCAIGAIEEALGKNHIEKTVLFGWAETAAPDAIMLLGKKINPSIQNVRTAAEHIASVNNLKGKDAILRVFDDAISALEVSELCQQVEKEGGQSDGIPSDTRVPETVSR